MGAGFLVAAQWTLEPMLYIAGFVVCMVQVATRKQWNLVALNLKWFIAWFKHLITIICGVIDGKKALITQSGQSLKFIKKQ